MRRPSTARTVNVREARQQLSRLLDAAETGQVVTITRSGKPVARLVPVEREEPFRFPDLSAFRASMPFGTVSSADVISQMRDEEG
jgi:prevent-host-death family protein